MKSINIIIGLYFFISVFIIVISSMSDIIDHRKYDYHKNISITPIHLITRYILITSGFVLFILTGVLLFLSQYVW